MQSAVFERLDRDRETVAMGNAGKPSIMVFEMSLVAVAVFDVTGIAPVAVGLFEIQYGISVVGIEPDRSGPPSYEEVMFQCDA